MNRSIFISLVLGLAVGCGDDPVPPKPPPPGEVDSGSTPPPQAQRPLGQLEAPQGVVTLERGTEKRAAKVEPLFARDAIETGADGSATLRFGGDRVVELGPEGRFELEPDGTGLALKVLQGIVLTRIAATPAQEEGDVLLSISTPFGLTRLGSAEVGLKVDQDTADVDVKFGQVELVSKAGEVSKLDAGKKGFLGKMRELEAAPMQIVLSQGRAEYKAKGARAFVAINPKKLPTIGSGDTIRVKDGRFSMAPQGSSTRLSLLWGAEVGFVEARKGSGSEATALEVKKGKLEIEAPSGQTTRVGIAPGVTLVSDLGGQYSLRRTGSGFEVDALTGDLVIERDGEEKTVIEGGGSGVIPLKGKTVAKEATREVIVLPARTVRLLHNGSVKRVSVAWEGEDGVKEWRFQQATDAAFTNLVRDGVVRDPFVSLDAANKGGFYWRAFKGKDEIARGGVAFGAEARREELTRVQNEVQYSRPTTQIHYQDKDKPPLVTFTWAKEEGAAKYLMRVYREGELSRVVAERTVAELQAVLPENTLSEGKYLWSLTPLDAKGTEIRGGGMKKLEMVFDNAVPSLVIKTPQNGESVGKQVKTSGVAPVGTRLFINGKAIELDAQGRFEVTVGANGGRIVYRLLGNGPETWTVRAVRAK